MLGSALSSFIRPSLSLDTFSKSNGSIATLISPKEIVFDFVKFGHFWQVEIVPVLIKTLSSPPIPAIFPAGTSYTS